MAEYWVSIIRDEEYPTVQELAQRLAKDYGLVNYRGMPHCDFVRAFLEADLHNHGRTRMVKYDGHWISVYDNYENLFNFVEVILPELEEEKALAVAITNYQAGAAEKYWRVFLKESLKFYKKRPLNDMGSLRVYRGGKLMKISSQIEYKISSSKHIHGENRRRGSKWWNEDIA